MLHLREKYDRSVAQLVERRSPKPKVAGSIPVTPATLLIDVGCMFKGLKSYKFFEQVKQETKKVVWPEKKELTTSALIVVVSVFLFSIVSLIVDYGILNLVQMLLNIGK